MEWKRNPTPPFPQGGKNSPRRKMPELNITHHATGAIRVLDFRISFP